MPLLAHIGHVAEPLLFAPAIVAVVWAIATQIKGDQ
jgi:hypothetical protein